MAYKIVFRPFAENDLVALHRYIAENSSLDRAVAYINRIEHTCMSLGDFPFRCTLRDDLHPGLCIIGFERRISIAFVVERRTVRILRIFYAGRDFPEDWDDR